MQEIVWSVIHGPGSIDKREESLAKVFPCVEANFFGNDALQRVKDAQRPRLIKTHLQANFFERVLADKSSCPKFIVVLRNPKDLLVSFYHFHRSWPGTTAFPDNWELFFEKFKNKSLLYGDYFDHVLSWHRYKDHPNVLTVKYEDMKKDAAAVIKQVGDLVGVTTDDDTAMKIAEETSFDAMKSRPPGKMLPAVGKDFKGFFRKGATGTWKEELFTDEQIKCVDDLVAEKLTPEGIAFEWTSEVYWRHGAPVTNRD